MISQNKKTVIVSRRDRICRGFTGYIIFLLCTIIFLLNYTSICIAAGAPEKRIPFQLGEKLTYKGKWGEIPAGELTLEVLPKETVNGVEAYHVAMITKTNAVVDLIYKIRERQDSYIDTGMTHSIFYKKKNESKHPRDESITFDWQKFEATCTKFGKENPPVKIMPGTFDLLALFYVLRFQNLKQNSEIKLPLTDGDLNIEVKVIVGKRSIIEVEGKKYETIEITPNMEMLDKLDKYKVVKKSDNPQLKVWVTADEKKIPVKIRSKVGIISFDFDLVTGLY
jgi:hypothetical protein